MRQQSRQNGAKCDPFTGVYDHVISSRDGAAAAVNHLNGRVRCLLQSWVCSSISWHCSWVIIGGANCCAQGWYRSTWHPLRSACIDFKLKKWTRLIFSSCRLVHIMSSGVLSSSAFWFKLFLVMPCSSFNTFFKNSDFYNIEWCPILIQSYTWRRVSGRQPD